MHRLLIGLRLCAIVSLVSGCWHEAFHTSFENGAGAKINVVIHFNGSKTPVGHGDIEPGNGVDLPQKIKDISYIEYQIGEQRCQMSASQIAKAAHSEGQGVMSVTLRDCNDPTSLSAPVAGGNRGNEIEGKIKAPAPAAA